MNVKTQSTIALYMLRDGILTLLTSKSRLSIRGIEKALGLPTGHYQMVRQLLCAMEKEGLVKHLYWGQDWWITEAGKDAVGAT